MKLAQLLRHSCYAMGGMVFGSAIATLTRSSGSVHLLSLATGYAAFAYFCATLLIGPLRVLRGGRPLLSGRTRRHLGIWCGVFALIHVAFGINVHLGGDYMAYFFEPNMLSWKLRLDPFGITNDLGLLGVCGIIWLLALSNDASLRSLGPARWKAWQRSAYPLFGIVVVHSLVYQMVEQRLHVLIALFVVTVAVVLSVRLRAYAMRRNMPAS